MLRYFVYGNYIDEVLMMRNVKDSESLRKDLDLYFVHDGLFSCRALVDEDGVIVERARYDVYGQPEIWLITDVTGDGIHNNDDYPAYRDSYQKSECDADYNWMADYNNDGTVNNDWTIYGRFYQKSVPAGYESFFKNPYYFTGRRIDALDKSTYDDPDAFDLQHSRNRTYDFYTGRFLQYDPLGVRDEICIIAFNDTGNPLFPRNFDAQEQYKDGMNLYEYVKSSPISKGDPYGLSLPSEEPTTEPPRTQRFLRKRKYF